MRPTKIFIFFKNIWKKFLPSFAMDNDGFSLIELFVILVLISLGAFLAFSGWNSPENRVRSAAFQIAADLRLSRTEAVKRNEKVLMCKTGNHSYQIKTASGRSLTGQKEIDKEADNSTRVQLVLTYSGNCAIFNPIGTSSNGHFIVSLGPVSRTIITNRSGRIKVQ